MLGLTFLGTSNYSMTTYEFQGRKVETHLFPIAFAEFFPLDEMKVVVTEQAKEMHFSALKQKLKDKCIVEDIIVPAGKSEKELWAMFDEIVAKIPPESEILIDVTHGFRSMPILSLAISVYLRRILNVKIKHILYGAFDAPDKKDNITPVFDLTSFLFLIDWTLAIDKFVNLGHAKELSILLEQSHQQAYQKPANDSSDLPRKLKSLAGKIGKVTNALAAIRPKETTETAFAMVNSIDNVTHEVETWAKPFAATLNQARDEYSNLISRSGQFFDDSGLHAQMEIIKWYLDKQQYAQAITLAREWLISKVCTMKNLNPAKDQDRNFVTKLLGKWTENIKNQNPIPGKIGDIACKEVAKLYGSLCDIRNDMNHAGMREFPRSAKSLIKNIQEICAKLEEISASSG